MSFRSYKCKKTGELYYAFRGEEHRLPGVIPGPRGSESLPVEKTWPKLYDIQPPNPTVVIGTATWMAGVYLDSMKSMYELDRLLNIEAEQEREDKAYQELVKHI